MSVVASACGGGDPLSTTDIIANRVGSACRADDGHLAVDDPFKNPDYLKRYYGKRFNALVNAHSVQVVSASCEVAGGGAIYFKFDGPRALHRAIAAHPPRPPLCVLSPTEMFDDDYVNGAARQLAKICAELGGRRIRA